jgi:septum formation protein
MKHYPFIDNTCPLILASESPRRKDLLNQMGIPFSALPCNIDERRTAGHPSFTARTLAEKKAMAAFQRVQGQWILGADTIVVTGALILGKPVGEADARSMLITLSNKDHEVITGYAIADPAGRIAFTGHETTLVSIKPLSGKEIEAYIATKEPFGKAGAYAIQGIGAFMVEGIRGSYSNVVGLPMCALVKGLLEIGALKEFPIKKGSSGGRTTSP